MSLEVTLQNIADAINRLADATSYSADVFARKSEHFATTATGLVVNKASRGVRGSSAEEAAADYIPGVKSKAEPTDAQIDAEIDAAAVTQVEAAAKNAASAAGTATAAADTQSTAGAADTATDAAQTSYDYAKDVQPLLVKVGKNRDQLVALLKSFGAAKGADIKPADYAAVIAKANELIAG